MAGMQMGAFRKGKITTSIVEKLALKTDSGGAGKRRGGLGYEKHYRALVDCHTIVTADRVRLGCYGVDGGKAGKPFCVTVDAENRAKQLGGLVDGEPVKAGQLVVVVTTGGGGWGDPLMRETYLVQQDVTQGKVSREAARADYGVVIVELEGQAIAVDEAATACLRRAIASQRNGPLAMIDRGEGYDRMLEGQEKPRV